MISFPEDSFNPSAKQQDCYNGTDNKNDYLGIDRKIKRQAEYSGNPCTHAKEEKYQPRKYKFKKKKHESYDKPYYSSVCKKISHFNSVIGTEAKYIRIVEIHTKKRRMLRGKRNPA
jgi:hypothetical protein